MAPTCSHPASDGPQGETIVDKDNETTEPSWPRWLARSAARGAVAAGVHILLQQIWNLLVS